MKFSAVKFGFLKYGISIAKTSKFRNDLLCPFLIATIGFSFIDRSYSYTPDYDYRVDEFTSTDLYRFTPNLSEQVALDELPAHLRQKLQSSNRPIEGIYRGDKYIDTYVIKYSDGSSIFPGIDGKWNGSYEFLGDDLGEIEPNCQAPFFGIKEFRALFNRPDINSKDELLKALPPGALPRFTFITHSDSLQKEGVDFHNPRILRFSADAQFAMTFTCDNRYSSGETIEISYYDFNEDRFHFVHAQFPDKTDQSGLLQRSEKSLTQNHRACLSCHGGNDPRPNWHQYQKWRGVIGKYDDQIKYQDTYQKEYSHFDFNYHKQYTRDEYRMFKENLVGQSCFDTLPFPNNDPFANEYYPYVPKASYKPDNYQYRVNAQFSVASDRLNARRLARKFSEQPIYHKLKELLVADAMQCDYMTNNRSLEFLDTPTDNSSLEFYLKSRSLDRGYENKRGAKTYARLLRLSWYLGFYGSDWHLHFDQKNKKRDRISTTDESGERKYDWVTVEEFEHRFDFGPNDTFLYYHAGNWRTYETLFGRLLEMLGHEYPELNSQIVFLNWWENVFGSDLKCVDDIASKYWFDPNRDQRICEVLKPVIEAKGVATTSQTELEHAFLETRVRYQFRQNRPLLNDINIEAGKHLAQSTCGSCHNGRVLNYNFKDENVLQAQLRYEEFDLRNTVEAYLGDSEFCMMPFPASGDCFSDNERESLLLYLDSLIQPINK